ncbi:MAG: ATP synthase F1 subunit epsilon [Oscillospiraceae bacterium]|jgi:F-type H+-transporting ATPase subunit epsilon|nr:ATP synthase F1 subunit epsilon [Oscillospiraceae bacterium]
MAGFDLRILTPTKVAFAGVAKSVSFMTTEGEACILRGHEDYVAPLAVGAVRIETEDGERRLGCSSYGFVNVLRGNVSIFLITFEFVEEIDIARATEGIEKMSAIIAGGATGDELMDAKARHERCKMRLKVAKLSG